MALADDLQAVMSDYVAAYDRGDAAGCAAAFTGDAALISPFGPPAHGHEAIRAAHRAWFDEPEEGKTLEVLEAEAHGDLGWCLVRYSATVTGADGRAKEDAGTNLCVLHRDALGRWAIHRSCLVPDPQAGD